MTPWTSDLVGALILAGGFLLLLVVAESWSRLANPNPEMPRKLVHAAGGVGCLFFPFLVQSPWVVLALALGMSALFALGGRLAFLRCLHGVARKSRGSEYYPLAIFLVYLASYGRPWLYVASILVLALADASAALIGSQYGRLRYTVEDESKSLEGSLVFLVVAFLAIHLPTLLMTDLPRPVCVLAALLVALLVTGFEVVSLHGADNLFIPLGVCVILDRITGKPLGEIAYQNVSLLVLCAVLGIIAWRARTFNTGGTILVVLAVYGCWSLGGVEWALPIFLGVVLFVACRTRLLAKVGSLSGIRVRVAFRAVSVPFAFLVVANASGRYGFFYGGFLASSAVMASLACWKCFTASSPGPGERWLPALLLGLLPCCALIVGVPGVLLCTAVGAVLTVALAATVTVVLVRIYQRARPFAEGSAWWRGSDSVACLVAGLAVLGLQMLGAVSAWRIGE
jgi:dolichol kinase